MTGEALKSAVTSEQPRKRYGSTYLVGFVLALIMIFLNLPGRVDIRWDVLAAKDSLKPTYPRFEDETHCLHGWPLAFLCREAYVYQGTPPTPQLSFWKMTTGVKRFSGLALLIDVVLALLIVAVLTGLYQRWRDRRKHILQMHVIDVMGIAGAVAIASWILAYNYSILAHEERAIDRITRLVPKSVNWGEHAFSRARWKPSRIAWVKQFREHPYVSVFDRIVGFSVGGEELPLLSDLQHLQYVQIRGQVSNEQLQTLTKLPRLIVLDVSAMQVNSEGTVSGGALRLPPLPKLRGLNFGGSAEFRGEGLEGLQQIEVLDLSGTALTDEGLKAIGNLKRLKHLYLDGTAISEDGLAALRQHPSLERLSVRFLPVGEVGLQHLATIEQLRWLYLYRGDPLNEQEISIVASMKQLQNPQLGLADDVQLRQLKNAFPGEDIWQRR